LPDAEGAGCALVAPLGALADDLGAEALARVDDEGPAFADVLARGAAADAEGLGADGAAIAATVAMAPAAAAASATMDELGERIDDGRG
jgi:hypothetical protein